MSEPAKFATNEEREAEVLRQAAEASAAAAGEPTYRAEVLASLPTGFREVVAPIATSSVRQRVELARELRDTEAWRAAGTADRAAALWLAGSITVAGRGTAADPSDHELPAGFKRAISAVVGERDRAGGWRDAPDAPEAEPTLLEVETDWTEPAPDRVWRIGEWMPEGRVGIVTGRAAAGKSRLMAQVAARLAAGPGMAPSRCVIPGAPQSAVIPHSVRTLIVSYEDEQDEIRRRIRQMSIRPGPGAPPTGADLAEVGNGVAAFDARGAGVLWGPREGQHDRTAGALTPFGAQVLATAEAHGAGLLVLDPAAAAFGSDESSRNHVRVFLDHLDQWGSTHGCSVAVVMHPPKRQPGAGPVVAAVDDDSMWAGSGDWRGAARWGWTVGLVPTGYEREPKGDERKPKPVLALALASLKQSYGPDPAPIFLAPAGYGWTALTAEAAAHMAAAERGWTIRTGEGASGEAQQRVGAAADPGFD